MSPREAVAGAPALPALHVHNRKFIGSKFALLPFITEVVDRCCPDARTAADLFAGTGVVAYALAVRGLAVVAGDNLYSCYVPLRAFLTGGAETRPDRVAGLLRTLAALPGKRGYVWENYGGRYFTEENAARIDAIREQIAAWAAGGVVDAAEEAMLLTSLLYAADKVANTCGQYDAYLKHLGREAYSPDGTHLVDASVYRPLTLGMPVPAPGGHRHRVFLGDANELVRRVEVDLLYLDPPYNTRQYIDNYHVLENIARWERPPLYGKTRKFRREAHKSRYSRRGEAARALAELVRDARCRHILLSYSAEGILPHETLVRILETRGDVAVYTRRYTVFGNGAGRSRRRPVLERLYYCRVTRP